MGLIAGFVGDNKKGVLDIAPVDAVVNIMLASLTKKGREELQGSKYSEDSVNDDTGVSCSYFTTLNPLNVSVFLQIVKQTSNALLIWKRKAGAVFDLKSFRIRCAVTTRRRARGEYVSFEEAETRVHRNYAEPTKAGGEKEQLRNMGKL